MVGKPKVSNFFTCATLSSTAVGSVMSTEATTSAAVPWPCLRAQMTSPDASQRPCVSTESDILRSSISLVCSGGTAHPPPTQPRPQQTSPKAARAQQYPQQHPRSLPARPLRLRPRQLAHSRHCESRQQVPTPLPSADEALSQKRRTLRQSFDLVCGDGLRFRSPFSHTPQPSAQISLQRR